MKISRNDPCPCGSGQKYKKCCLERRQTPTQLEIPADVLAEVRQTLEGKEFASLEEMNAFLSKYMNQRNQASREDFAGLSPEQMHRFLHFPFESPDLVSFPENLAVEPAAPIMTLFQLLAEAIGKEGLKPTAKGNLPRNFCRETALAYWGEKTYSENTRFGNINKEDDFTDLHVTRIIAELAGLIRKNRGRFILSRDCRKFLEVSGMAGIYPQLFRSGTLKFNWAYRDRYPELGFIQQSFLFTLYLLHRHGKDWRPDTFYEDHFLSAFPMILKEVPPESYFTPEQTVRSCYSFRTLENFARFFGLAKVEAITTEDHFSRQLRIIKLPLLENAIMFRV